MQDVTARRYAHINALRGDRVGAEMLGVSKVVSEDSVRRALQRGTPEEWDEWLTTQERAVYEPLLSEAHGTHGFKPYRQ